MKAFVATARTLLATEMALIAVRRGTLMAVSMAATISVMKTVMMVLIAVR